MKSFKGHVLRDARMASANAKTTAPTKTGVPDDTTWALSSYSSLYQSTWGDYSVRTAYWQYQASVLEGRENENEEYLIIAAQNANLGVSVEVDEETEEETHYEPLFHWTRNDPDLERFHWVGAEQRWLPIKGSPPLDLGFLELDKKYKLRPPPNNLIVNETLEGPEDANDWDSFAVIRIGLRPDSMSKPIGDDESSEYRGILVIPDELIEEEFDFSITTPPYAGLIGKESGILVWNQEFAKEYVGQTIWFIPKKLNKKSTGLLGPLSEVEETPLFVTPVPQYGERPLIRIGNRKWLSVLYAQNDADQEQKTVSPGYVCVSMTTGKLSFSQDTINKSKLGSVEEPNEDIDPLFVGAKVYSDGLLLNCVPQPLRKPALLSAELDSDDTLTIPQVILAPGLGVCGIRKREDKTGRQPTQDISYHRAVDSGLVRGVKGWGDTFVYSPGNSVSYTSVVDTEDDLPSFDFSCKVGRAYITKGNDTDGSQLMLHPKDIKRRSGEPFYFQQSEFPPAQYAIEAKIFSRKNEPYRIRGDETFRFIIDGVLAQWDASTLTQGVVYPKGEEEEYTAAEIAQDIIETTNMSAENLIVFRGRLGLQAVDLQNGTIEILPGAAGNVDLSGCAALGFNPFWRVSYPIPPGVIQYSNEDTNWLVDTGSCVGLSRSRLNLRGTSTKYTDFQTIGRIETTNLGEIRESPFVFLQQIPLEDEPGIEGYDGVFFESRLGVFKIPLLPLKNVRYLFEEKKLQWLEKHTFQKRFFRPIVQFPLDKSIVVGDTLHPALNGQIKVSYMGEKFHHLERDTHFLLNQDGMTGIVTLIDVHGGRVFFGAKGGFEKDSDSFSDPNYLTSDVLSELKPGQRLKILNTESKGHYTITEIQNTAIKVFPPFLYGSQDTPVSWEIYEMETEDVIEHQIVADRFYQQFNHLPKETFTIVRMHPLATVGDDGQLANTEQLGTLGEDSQLGNVDFGADFDRGRNVYVQFGTEKDATKLEVIPLQTTEVGVISKTGLTLDFADPHFQSLDFVLRIGSEEYNVQMVLEWTEEESFGPDVIECIQTTGELQFGANILDVQENATVVYRQTPSTIIPETVQVDVRTGHVFFAASDLQKEIGKTIFWVAQMITEESLDVALNPLAGAFFFNEPLKERDMVEVKYFQSDMGGALKLNEREQAEEIQEFLPLYVRAEVCTRIDSRRYMFNLQNKMLHTEVAPVVYVGPEMQNYGGIETITIDYENSIIYFSFDVDSSQTVKATYAVLDCFGGEASFTVSKAPVYRPPFRLEGNSTSFSLQGDRTIDNELCAGMLMRIGATHIYFQTVVYDEKKDTTTVDIFPPIPSMGAGSSAPGNDVMCLVSSHPIAHKVNDVDVESAKGFLVSVEDYFESRQPYVPEGDSTSIYWETISKGQMDVTIHADVSDLQAGHLIEIAGYPHSILNVALLDDGNRTKITFVPACIKNLTFEEDSLYVSVRPLYPPGRVPYIGVGPFVPEEPFELIIWEVMKTKHDTAKPSYSPGRTLIVGDDYNYDFNTGEINFNPNVIKPVGVNQKLTFARTAMKRVKPRFQDGVMLPPRIKSRFRFGTLPSEDNNLLQADLIASYSFYAPDSFYYRVVHMEEYANQAAVDIQERATQGDSAFGPSLGTPSGSKNHENGQISLRGTLRDLYDQDRAARQYLNFYNQVVVCFEQIQETVEGLVIGDRDGRFKYSINSTYNYTPKGFENAITGRLNPRLVWADVFQRFASGSLADFILYRGDYIVEPWSATQDPTTKSIDGDIPNSYLLNYMIQHQRVLIENDLDDLVLTGLYRPKMTYVNGSIKWCSKGRYETMAQPHFFSRIYPETCTTFTTLMPGLDASLPGADFGEFRFSKIGYNRAKERDEIKSTFRNEIGEISNPPMGIIKNIQDILTAPRSARARIWQYEPYGFPELDAIIGSDFESNPRPAVIATPVPIKDLPIDLSTGLPDITRLATIMGDDGVPDLNTGDWDLHTPPFETDMRLVFGRTNGDFISVGYSGTDVSTGGYSPLFVDALFGGIIITFKDVDGNSITNPELLLEMTSLEQGQLLLLDRGDTIAQDMMVGTKTKDIDDVDIEDLKEVSSALPNYRNGFDLGYNKRKGYYRDVSMPSGSDPSFLPIKEMTGQKSPEPGTRVESKVDFIQSSIEPIVVPALLGEAKNDSGDYQLPYLASQLTEIDVLRTMMSGCAKVLLMDGPGGLASHDWLAIYPDEILCGDATITDFGVLTTGKNLEPVQTNNYIPNSGIGNARAWDLFFIQCENTNVNAFNYPGATGIHSVGRISDLGGAYVIEPPRFIVPTQGFETTIHIQNLMAFTGHDEGYLRGLMMYERVNETGPATDWRTEIWLRLDSFNGDLTWEGAEQTLVDMIVGEWIEFGVLKRPGDPSNPTTGDGDTLSLFRLEKTMKGGSATLLDDGGGPHNFKLLVYDVATGVLTEEIELYPDEGVLLYTDSSGNKHLVVRTYHPNDEDLTLNPVRRARWFNFSDYADVQDDGNVANDGLPLARWTAGVDSQNNSLYLDFFSHIEVSSDSCFINEDRLTFQLSWDVRVCQPIGFTHPLNGSDWYTQLTTKNTTLPVTDSAGVDVLLSSDINHINTINVGIPFFFHATSTLVSNGLFGVGYFDVNTQLGSLRVPSFEGQGNTLIEYSSEEITCSVAASSEYCLSGLICTNGFGLMGGEDGGVVYHEDRILITDEPTTGLIGFDVSNVEKGDTVVVKERHTAGTYLVRHTIPAQTLAGVHYVSEIEYSDTDKWYNKTFPWIKAIDTSGPNVVLDVRGFELSDSPSGTYFPSTVPFKIFILMEEEWTDSNDVVHTNTVIHPDMSSMDLQYRVISVEVTQFSNTQMTIDTSTMKDALGNVVASNLFVPAFPGKKISGFRYIPVHTHLRSQNASYITGHRDETIAAYGFEEIVFEGVDGQTVSKSIANNDLKTVASLSAAGEIGVAEFDGSGAGTYQEEYRVKGTATYLDLSNWVETADFYPLWDVFSFAHEVKCLLPQLKINSVFLAEAGIFLEPSFPKPVRDLSFSDPSLVCNEDAELGFSELTLADHQTGARRAGDFVGNPATWYNHISFTVRRIRRFHDIQEGFSTGIDKLRYMYMTRRGTIQSVSGMTVMADPTGTNLGLLTSELVGVKEGCIIRVLDDAGDVKCWGKIAKVTGSDSLTLCSPGWISDDGSLEPDPGDVFEIYLQTLAPHEQSNEQLLELCTDTVLFRQTHDLQAQLYGGVVQWEQDYPASVGYEASCNILRDMDDTVNYAQLGVAAGDILVVDPIGVIVEASDSVYGVDERGMRAYGDIGVSTRNGFEPGSPSSLDDNRGFYEIKEVYADRIHVGVFDNAVFAGPIDSPLVFASDDPTQSFALYPTVSNSDLTAGAEGQMDLRPTAFRGEDLLNTGDVRPNTFLDSPFSVGPFPYKIIRPNSSFSTEAIQLILFHRERILSWIDAMDYPQLLLKYGDYHVFQRDRHLFDMGSVNIPELGIGLLSNSVIYGFVGRITETPFMNDSDCMSVLDRLVLCQDEELDVTVAPFVQGSTNYTKLSEGVGRPLLIDLLVDVLDNADQMRDIRLSWVEQRAHRTEGTMAAIRLYKKEMKRRKNKQKRTRRMM